MIEYSVELWRMVLRKATWSPTAMPGTIECAAPASAGVDICALQGACGDDDCVTRGRRPGIGLDLARPGRMGEEGAQGGPRWRPPAWLARGRHQSPAGSAGSSRPRGC